MSTWLELAQAVVPLVLGIGAYYLGGVNERRRDERTLAREDAARVQLRQQAVEIERHTFQRETLLDLQTALPAIARIGFLTLLADRKTIVSTGKFGMLPASIGGADSMEVTGNYNRLANRVLDDQLRASLLEFGESVNAWSTPPSNWSTLEQSAALALVDQRIGDAGPQLQAVSSAVGIALRHELGRD